MRSWNFFRHASSRRILVARYWCQKRGTVIKNNTIYVSPASAHLICGQRGAHKIVDHLDYYPDNRSPSVDALFVSVAEIYGQDALAIVLSGMDRSRGREGAGGE